MTSEKVDYAWKLGQVEEGLLGLGKKIDDLKLG